MILKCHRRYRPWSLFHNIFFLLMLCQQNSFGQNPVIRDIGMSDPHIRVFNDTVYLYCGHDSNPEDKTWIMKDWRVFSSTDLINWTLEETISPKDNYMDDNSSDCWAGDAAGRNGKYYFYFSDRKRGIGVMKSTSPSGPFEDALRKPLVSPMHDPTILIDDDPSETPYIVYGDKAGGGFHVARLNHDMISLAEKPRPVAIIGAEWEDAPEWMDKNYIFKYKNRYYLSWGRDYAISENIYGPYKCVGAVGNGHHLNEFAHGSFFWWKGQFYHIWCYYLKSGFKYRESIITYCHFKKNGEVVTDTRFLDQHFENGVGQYDASWEKIEAEWFYEKSRELVKEEVSDHNFQISGMRDGSWLRFANVEFGDSVNSISLKLLNPGDKSNVEVRAGSISGKLLGTVAQATGSASEKVFNIKLENIKGKHDVYLIFKGGHTANFALDWLKFSNQ